MNIINLLKKKWIFKKNSKINVLSVDDNYAKLKLKLKNASFEVFQTNEINCYYLFMALFAYFFNFKKNLDLKSTYLKIIIESYNPDIIIGHELCVRVFKIKKLFPYLTTIVYQYAICFRKRGKIHNNAEIRLKNTECDFFLIYNDSAKEVFKNVKTEFIITGSVKANARPRIVREKKYDIMYISEFREIDKLNLDKAGLYNVNDPIKRGELGYLEVGNKNFGNICSSYILSVLNEYSLINNKKFCIGRSSRREDKIGKISMTDENYFHRIFAPNHLTEDVDTETLAEKSNLIICLTSNLGAELMLKGHKVLFLNINSFAIEWPFKENLIDEPFWYKGSDKKEIFEKINQMFSLTNDEWKKKSSNHFDFFKFYDPENSILNSLIEKIIYKKN